MKPDWKAISKSPGYLSLKASYINTVKRGRSFDTKQQLYLQFNKIITRAIKHSIHTGVSVERVLELWENDRTYDWVNYYNHSKIKAVHSKSLKPLGMIGARKYFKSRSYYSKEESDRIWRRWIRGYQPRNKIKYAGYKARWDMRRIKDGIRIRQWKAEGKWP